MTDLFKSSAICMTRLDPADELLVAKGNVGVILNSSGRVSRRASMVWSDLPVAIAFSNPYVVAFLPGYVEVKTVNQVSTDAPAQVRRGFRYAMSRGTVNTHSMTIYVASDFIDVWCLVFLVVLTANSWESMLCPGNPID